MHFDYSVVRYNLIIILLLNKLLFFTKNISVVTLELFWTQVFSSHFVSSTTSRSSFCKNNGTFFHHRRLHTKSLYHKTFYGHNCVLFCSKGSTTKFSKTTLRITAVSLIGLFATVVMLSVPIV